LLEQRVEHDRGRPGVFHASDAIEVFRQGRGGDDQRVVQPQPQVGGGQVDHGWPSFLSPLSPAGGGGGGWGFGCGARCSSSFQRRATSCWANSSSCSAASGWLWASMV